MGGSVTAGQTCDVNPLDLPDTNYKVALSGWCAYPNRLQVLLNRVLFPGRPPRDREKHPVFQVTNMAVPGTSSQVGAMAMEYNLVPALERSPPHIVIASYSANDAKEDEQQTFYENQQDLVRAAHRLRPCDDHLPLVVLADDWFSHQVDLVKSLANTGSLYKTASWYNLMAIMYTSVVRATAIAHANFTETEGHPMFGSSRASKWHLGMGFHIAQGWTLFFNLLGALHDACSHQSSPPPLDVSLKDGAFAIDDDAPQNRSAPELAAELPIKYVGRYKDDGKDVLSEWDATARLDGAQCAAGPAAAAARPLFATSNCAYAWMVNGMTSVWSGPAIQRALDHVLVERAGWVAHHERRKPGWLTGAAHAHFAIEVRNITMDVNTFTLLSFKSYGPDWIDSRLLVDIQLIPGTGVVEGHEPLQVFVDGYHNKTISVPYPHRFRLPGTGARVGDTVRATFTLVNGTAFKIVGMAFCQSLAEADE